MVVEYGACCDYRLVCCIPQLTNILITLGSLCNVIVVAIVCLSVLASRKNFPKIDANHFRSPGGKVLPLVTLAILIASYVPSILQGGWQLWVATAVYYLLGMLLYRGRRQSV